MTKKHNVIIVGAGLFGSIAATLARLEGYTVTLIDSGEPWAASKASGCVLAPSWLTSLSKDQVATAMSVLEELYVVHPLELHSNILGKVFKAKRVNPDEALLPQDITDAVVKIGPGWVKTGKGATLRGKVLVAAGLGCAGLVEGLPAMKALWGASVRFKAQLPNDLISVYAPYRQAVLYQLDKKTVWGGDGTALIEKTWEKEIAERCQQTVNRLIEVAGKSWGSAVGLRHTDVRAGARPYMDGHKAGYFAKVMKDVWVSTGGAKNGTVLAALQAHKFVEVLNASH